jgi:hypothetical protein
MVHNVIGDGGKKVTESFTAEDSNRPSRVLKQNRGQGRKFPLTTGNIFVEES